MQSSYMQFSGGLCCSVLTPNFCDNSISHSIERKRTKICMQYTYFQRWHSHNFCEHSLLGDVVDNNRTHKDDAFFKNILIGMKAIRRFLFTYLFYFLLCKKKKIIVSRKFLPTSFWWIFKFWDFLNTIWLFLENVCLWVWQTFCGKYRSMTYAQNM